MLTDLPNLSAKVAMTRNKTFRTLTAAWPIVQDGAGTDGKRDRSLAHRGSRADLGEIWLYAGVTVSYTRC